MLCAYICIGALLHHLLSSSLYPVFTFTLAMSFLAIAVGWSNFIPSYILTLFLLLHSFYTRQRKTPNTTVMPFEVFALIFDHVEHASTPECYQRTLYSACLVSRHWYRNTTPSLYRRPLLDQDNYARFADRILPCHGRYSAAAELVRVLDLSKLDHHKFVHVKPIDNILLQCRTELLTIQVLNALRHHLKSFIAPQVGLTVHFFPTLARCRRLQKLDFSQVGGAVSLAHFLRLLPQFPELADVRFPAHCTSMPFRGSPPLNLKALQSLQSLDMGLLSWAAYRPLCNALAGNAASLTSLSIGHVPSGGSEEFRGLLTCLSTRLS